MKWLALLVLAQNINVTPIETRQNGVRVPQRVVQRQYVIDCRTNMTCGVDGGVLYLSAAAGSSGGSSYDGGKVGEAYMADASITAQVAQTAYSADAAYFAQTAAVAVVAQTAYSADASVYSAAFDHDPSACAVGQYVTDISPTGVLTCSTPSGGGGGGAGNFAEAQVVLTTSGYFSQAVAASWVTASSRIVCGVFGADDAGLTAEVVALAQLGVSVNVLDPGVGFTISLINQAGLEGTVAIHCTGG